MCLSPIAESKNYGYVSLVSLPQEALYFDSTFSCYACFNIHLWPT